MNELDMMQRFMDPEIISRLSKSELLQGSLLTTLMGMGTTFIVLILLWGIVSLMSKLLTNFEQKTVEMKATVAQASSDPKKADISQKELTAVITAAIAAAEVCSFCDFTVRKINKIPKSLVCKAKAAHHAAWTAKKTTN